MKETSLSQAPAYASQESLRVQRLVHLLDIFMLFLARQWLAIANLAAGLYVGLAALAPYLEHQGWREAARAIYLVYSFLCHQQPNRCFTIFGHQMAIRQRCVGIYAGFLAGGLLFGLLRAHLKPLPWRAYVVLNLPLVADSLIQLLGLWESTWYLRMVTGGGFGLSSVWLVYPYIQQGMTEVQETVPRPLGDGWKSDEGRTG